MFIRAKIVEDVIVDLLFHQDHIEGVTQKHSMALLREIEDCGEDGVDNVTAWMNTLLWQRLVAILTFVSDLLHVVHLSEWHLV